MSLKNLKVGDPVFVVHQMRRWETEVRTESAVVETVGRKYGTVNCSKVRFDLATGQSVHTGNERLNGYGFEVYMTEEEYQKKIEAAERFLELSRRLCGERNPWLLLPLDPATVEAIHEILDRVAK